MFILLPISAKLLTNLFTNTSLLFYQRKIAKKSCITFKMFSFKDILLLVGIMFFQTIFLYFMTRNNSQEAQNQINTKMTSTLKKQQKSISDPSETVKHLGYDIREVRDGVARSSNAGSGTSNLHARLTVLLFKANHLNLHNYLVLV